MHFHVNVRGLPLQDGPALPWPSGMREEPISPVTGLYIVLSSFNPHHDN